MLGHPRACPFNGCTGKSVFFFFRTCASVRFSIIRFHHTVCLLVMTLCSIIVRDGSDGNALISDQLSAILTDLQQFLPICLQSLELK